MSQILQRAHLYNVQLMSSAVSARLLPEVIRHAGDATVQSLADYQVLTCISENNFNKIYIATSTSSGRSVTFVIKSVAVDVAPSDISELHGVMKRQDRSVQKDMPEIQLDVSSFLAAEINVLKSLSHTNIITLHDVMCEASVAFGAHLYIGM